MTIENLNEKLDQTLDTFQKGLENNWQEGGDTPVNENDLHWIGRYTFYALTEFKEDIIEYLKTK